MASRAIAGLLAGLALAIAGCGSGQTNQGRIRMGVDASALVSVDSFCVTWKLYQFIGDSWTLMDQQTTPQCTTDRGTVRFDFATCRDGYRYLVEYNVQFLQAGQTIGTALATSGGATADVCMRDFDIESIAVVQFGEDGAAGGVNPTIEIDRVCSSNKLQEEKGLLVSAVWLQPDSCLGTRPDTLCAIASGDAISTARLGLSSDGLIRYEFNTAPLGATWDIWYLAFPPDLGTELILRNNPWVLHHWSTALANGKAYAPAFGSFAIANEGAAPSIGFVSLIGDSVVVVADSTGACNAPIARDASMQVIPAPACTGTIKGAGLVKTGDTTFAIVLDCDGKFTMIPCNAKTTVCTPAP